MVESKDRKKDKNRIAILLSGAIGAVVSVVADLTQKGTASATLQVGDAMRLVGIPGARAFAGILFIGLGMALCFILDAKSKRQALSIGAAVISFTMALVPYKPPVSIPGAAGPLRSVEADFVGIFSLPIALAQPADGGENLVKARLSLILMDQTGATSATVSLKELSGVVLFRSTIKLPLPNGRMDFYGPRSPYIISVEAPGHQITECLAKPSPDGSSWFAVTLPTTQVPLFVQRVLQSNGPTPTCHLYSR